MTISYMPVLTKEDLQTALAAGHKIECNAWSNMDGKFGGGYRPSLHFPHIVPATYDSNLGTGWTPDHEDEFGYGNGWSREYERFNMALRAVIEE